MKKLVSLFALLLAALALAACGGGGDDTTGATGAAGAVEEAEGGTAGSATVDVEADPSGALAYTSDEASAGAGRVTINFTNSSPVPHDVAIEDEAGETIAKTEVLAEGSDSAKADLKPGEYTFYCSVPGHRQGGMEGTLTVE